MSKNKTNKDYLENDYRKFIATSRYARWLDEENRRETWEETVGRYVNNIVERALLAEEGSLLAEEIRYSILNCDVMPSMRSMMTAGEAAERDNTCMFNCAYTPVEKPADFDEAMFILLCGTGVGFSVERQYISQLPSIPSEFSKGPRVVVEDSKEGWALALRAVIGSLYGGKRPSWDTSKVRPAGAKLKTFGGRASGPAPLIDLFNFVSKTFVGAAGRKLSSIECHDIMCKIGEVVVVGGVRRSAMISLSNLSDDRMRHAKSGNWYEKDVHRALANNSVAYTERPDALSFLREWTALAESGSGERGIFNREAAVKQAGKNGRRKTNYSFGVNPCAEIILRPRQFCNLTEAVVRSYDTIETLKNKVRIATITGTIQSTYTYFPLPIQRLDREHRRRAAAWCVSYWYHGQQPSQQRLVTR